MSRTRALGLAAYKRLIEAAPAAPIDAIDNRLAAYKAGRMTSRELKAVDNWARTVTTPSKWYATDGSNRFYLFRSKRMTFLSGWHAFARIATTAYGDDAASAYVRHGGKLTDRRPAGWISAATLAGVRYGGLEGGPRDWGWRDNEDLDLSIALIEQLRAKNPDPYITGSLHEYGQHLTAALAA